MFQLRASGKETVLHAFTGGPDGGYSYGGLIRDSSGNFYASAEGGGDITCDPPVGCGTVYKIDATGNFTVIHTFSGLDGAAPMGDLVQDAAGNIYGTTSSGGTYDYGTVFKITP